MEEMNVMPTEANVEKKLSYEQLEEVANNLHKQCNALYEQLQNASMVNLFKRLDYLFKVVENKDAFSDEFVTKCVTEIETIMNPPVEETNDEE